MSHHHYALHNLAASAPEDELALAGSVVRRLDDVEDGRRRHRLAIHGQKRVALYRRAHERRHGFYRVHSACAIYERDPERPGRDADAVKTVFLDRQTAAFPLGERDERLHHRLAIQVRRVDVAQARTGERDDDVPGRDLPRDRRVGPDRADRGRAPDGSQAQLARGQLDLDDHFGLHCHGTIARDGQRVMRWERSPQIKQHKRQQLFRYSAEPCPTPTWLAETAPLRSGKLKQRRRRARDVLERARRTARPRRILV